MASSGIPSGAAASSSAKGAPSMIPMSNKMGAAANTALQATAATGDIRLAHAKASLTEAQEVLTRNLTPGSEAIKVITTQLKNLAEAVAELVGQTKEGYQQIIGEIRNTMSDLMTRSDNMGTPTINIIQRIFSDPVGSTEEGLRELEKVYHEKKRKPVNLNPRGN
jgi:phage-related protein